MRLRHLQNHTTLKHYSPPRRLRKCLRHLQNHTTLKRIVGEIHRYRCLRHLQNHTTLKPHRRSLSPVVWFETFTESHYSQTSLRKMIVHHRFETFTESHYSQTSSY